MVNPLLNSNSVLELVTVICYHRHYFVFFDNFVGFGCKPVQFWSVISLFKINLAFHAWFLSLSFFYLLKDLFLECRLPGFVETNRLQCLGLTFFVFLKLLNQLFLVTE